MLQQNKPCAYFYFLIIIVTGPLYVLRPSLYLICGRLLFECRTALLIEVMEDFLRSCGCRKDKLTIYFQIQKDVEKLKEKKKKNQKIKCGVTLMQFVNLFLTQILL